jgi:hypothetical protein
MDEEAWRQRIEWKLDRLAHAVTCLALATRTPLLPSLPPRRRSALWPIVALAAFLHRPADRNRRCRNTSVAAMPRTRSWRGGEGLVVLAVLLQPLCPRARPARQSELELTLA